ncbi:uncharacterized protein UTRI_10479 [Ustilago trichophora]|uniref:Uncharacterized protein n=1 Tax=Ustilago trichophora TaxID=86804 RepID=A0A5C3E9T8_9BASI|nr:uncharacterized protein UTRI_10479 [Ustilago trichophora]
MFRKASFRPSLLSALVCLLTWVAICIASPMGASTLTPRTEAALGIPYENAEANAYIQNLPHYNQLPMVHERIESPELIRLAQSQYGAVYLYHNPVHQNERFSSYIYRSGQRATRAPHDQVARLQSKLTAARTEGQQSGNAVRWLKHGRPFRRTDMSPFSWKEVWDGSQVLRAPSSQDSVDWLAIRNILQGQRRVVLADAASQKTIAFRLNALGQVESDAKDMVRALHRRSFTSSNDVPSRHILKTNSDGSKELFKRGIPFHAGPSAPQSQTLEFVLSYHQGFIIQHNLAPTSGGVAGLDRKWASTLHFREHPVLDVHTTSVGDLEQAVVDYDYVYVYGTKQGQSEPSIVQIFRSRAPIDPAPNSRLLRQVIEQSRRYEIDHGRLFRALIDGRPIQRIAGAPAEERVFFSGQGHPPLDLHAMRAALATSGSFRVENVNTGDTFHWTLNHRNLGSVVAELAHDVNLRHPFVKRTSQSDSSDIDHHFKLLDEADPASHQLVKRMDVERPRNLMKRAWEPQNVEYYSHSGFREPDPPLPAQTMVERSKHFANQLHYEGEPIFFPAEDPSTPAKAEQAIANHDGFWVVGNLVHDRTRTVALRIRRGGRSGADGDQKVLRHIMSANAFEMRYGRAGKFLKYGPGFPPRQSTSFRRYKVPSWDKVGRKAEEVPHTTPMSVIWEKLHQNNMLVVKEGTNRVGFALDQAGNVLHHAF